MAEKESELHLKIEPIDKIVFKGKKLDEEPAVVELKITNPTKERQAFKVKCTSNDMFRIRPPVSAIMPNESATVQLTFKSKSVPESGKHYFVVYHIKSDGDEKTPRQVWADYKGDPEGTKRLTVDFDKENDADINSEKKIDDKKSDEKDDDKKKEEGKEDDNEEEEKEKDDEDPKNEGDENKD